MLALGFSGMAVVAYLTYAFPGRIFQGLLLGTATVSILSIILSGRVLHLGDSGLDVYQDGGMGSTLFGKALLLILVGVAFSVCVAWWLWRLRNTSPALRYSADGSRGLERLTWAFAIYFVAFSLLPLAFAPQFVFHVSLVYPLFVWLALLLSLRTSGADPVQVLRQALGLIVLCSLAAAAIMPALALQPGYAGMIPGFSMRLWGVTASANTLGSVAGTLLVLQFIEKPHHSLRHHMLTGGAIAALLLTQSKTSMAGAFLGLAILFAWRIWRGSRDQAARPARTMAGIATLLFLCALFLAAAWLALSEPAAWNALERRLDPRAVRGLTTFTGRNEIWDYAIRRGLESPLFGNGLAMWDIHTRLATGLSGAVHAHNLFLQAFSRAGFVGLAALILLLAYIVRNTWTARNISAGGSMALLAMFLVRSTTEVPLQPNGILGGEFFAFMALLVLTTDRALSADNTRKPVESGYSSETRPIARPISSQAEAGEALRRHSW